MGQVEDWIFRETFPRKAGKLETLEAISLVQEQRIQDFQAELANSDLFKADLVQANQRLFKENERLKVDLALSEERRKLTEDNYAQALIRLGSYEKKFVEQHQPPPTIKAKTPADARRMAERAFVAEESDGIR